MTKEKKPKIKAKGLILFALVVVIIILLLTAIGVMGKTGRSPEKEKIEKKTDWQICKDLCGDGICQEVVCLAEGCPCAESPQSCPEDCLEGK